MAEINIYWYYVVLNLLIIIVCFPQVPEAVNKCRIAQPQDGTLAVFRNHCFLFQPEANTWVTALLACNHKGGNLIEIPDEATQGFVVSKMREFRWQTAWIGANDRRKEGKWVWTTGTDVGYSKWGSYYRRKRFLMDTLHDIQNTMNSLKNSARDLLLKIPNQMEDCAYVKLSDSGRWHDAPCSFPSFRFPYICQFDTMQTSPTAMTWSREVSSARSTKPPPKTTSNSGQPFHLTIHYSLQPNIPPSTLSFHKHSDSDQTGSVKYFTQMPHSTASGTSSERPLLSRRTNAVEISSSLLPETNTSLSPETKSVSSLTPSFPSKASTSILSRQSLNTFWTNGFQSLRTYKPTILPLLSSTSQTRQPKDKTTFVSHTSVQSKHNINPFVSRIPETDKITDKSSRSHSPLYLTSLQTSAPSEKILNKENTLVVKFSNVPSLSELSSGGTTSSGQSKHVTSTSEIINKFPQTEKPNVSFITELESGFKITATSIPESQSTAVSVDNSGRVEEKNQHNISLTTTNVRLVEYPGQRNTTIKVVPDKKHRGSDVEGNKTFFTKEIIIGLSVGAIIALVLAIVLLVIFKRRRPNKEGDYDAMAFDNEFYGTSTGVRDSVTSLYSTVTPTIAVNESCT